MGGCACSFISSGDLITFYTRVHSCHSYLSVGVSYCCCKQHLLQCTACCTGAAEHRYASRGANGRLCTDWLRPRRTVRPLSRDRQLKCVPTAPYDEAQEQLENNRAMKQLQRCCSAVRLHMRLLQAVARSSWSRADICLCAGRNSDVLSHLQGVCALRHPRGV